MTQTKEIISYILIMITLLAWISFIILISLHKEDEKLLNYKSPYQKMNKNEQPTEP